RGLVRHPRLGSLTDTTLRPRVQRREELGARREALVQIARHRFRDDRGKSWVEPRCDLLYGRGRLEHDLEDQLVERIRIERNLSGDGLVQNHASGVDVDARVDVFGAFRLLRRHVVGRTHDRARARHAELAAHGAELRDAEVEQLHEVALPLLAADEVHVVWLQIAMDDASGVRRPQPFEHLYGDGIHLRRGEAPAVVDATAERLAIHELHDHVALAVGELAEIEHLDDVLRPDAPRSLRFALETRDRITVGCDAG